MLEDAPVKSEMYNMSITELPGQVYSGDQQCKHLYGPKASVCKFDFPNVSLISKSTFDDLRTNSYLRIYLR